MRKEKENDRDSGVVKGSVQLRVIAGFKKMLFPGSAK